jgi:hypothetical protein
MSDKPPTAKQLAYLRALVERTGQTFAYPRTRRQATREIQRLKQTRPTAWIENREMEREIADAVAQGNADAARIRAHEVIGHGSNATWRERS